MTHVFPNQSNLALLNQFLKHIRVERGLSKATESTYYYQLKIYIEFLEGQKVVLAQVGRETILAFLETRKVDGLKQSSLFILVLAIRQYHRFLYASNMVSSDPTAGIKLPRCPQKIPEPLSLGELEKLLTIPPSDKFTIIRTRTMIDVAFSTGLRASELVNLRLDDIHLEEGWIRVRQGKGGHDRIIPIGEGTKESIQRYLKVRAERFGGLLPHLFLSSRGKPLTRGTFWWLLKRWAHRVGIKGRVSPHQLRHSFGTVLLSRGASLRGIQQAMGHSDLRSTTRYLHVDLEFLKETLRHHPRFSKDVRTV